MPHHGDGVHRPGLGQRRSYGDVDAVHAEDLLDLGQNPEPVQHHDDVAVTFVVLSAIKMLYQLALG